MPQSAPINNSDPSAAFYDQFSLIIRLESRLRRDNSEDITGPAHQRWAARHLAEVAQAQGYNSRLPAEETNFNARHFVAPPPAQTATNNHLGHVTPWYDNFNLADQGVLDSSGPYRPPTSTSLTQYTSHPPNSCAPFTPAERAAFHATVQTPPLFRNSTQRVPSVFAERDNYNYNSDPFVLPNHNHQPSQIPSTPPSHVRHSFPSTPPNQIVISHPRASSVEFSPDLFGNRTLRTNTEPIAQSARMSEFKAPDHYKEYEIYALEIQVGDYIQQEGQYSGKVISHEPSNYSNPTPTNTNTITITNTISPAATTDDDNDDDRDTDGNDAPAVNPNGALTISVKTVNGTRNKSYRGLQRVKIFREVKEDINNEEEHKNAMRGIEARNENMRREEARGRERGREFMRLAVQGEGGEQGEVPGVVEPGWQEGWTERGERPRGR